MEKQYLITVESEDDLIRTVFNCHRRLIMAVEHVWKLLFLRLTFFIPEGISFYNSKTLKDRVKFIIEFLDA